MVVVAVRGAVPPSCWLVCASHPILPITKSFFNFFQNLKFDWTKLDRDLFKYRIRCLGPKCAKSYEYPPRTSKPSSGRFFTVADPRWALLIHALTFLINATTVLFELGLAAKQRRLTKGGTFCYLDLRFRFSTSPLDIYIV